MQQVSADEAKEHLAELIDTAVKGETVLIIRDDEQAVRLVPVAQATNPATSHTKGKRRFGSAKGLIEMSDDFDASLADFEEYMP
jgi:antitoxin (DNA-binding transcriptional repressor) of toxin-antitoxin stability system